MRKPGPAPDASPPSAANAPEPGPATAPEAEPDCWYLKHRARIERWQRPLATPWDRLRAWTNMLLVDHGILRLVWSNTWRVTPALWRSAQPAPHNLRRFRAAGGRTVVTLRGGLTFGSLPIEREACARLGLDFRSFTLRSRGLPGRDELAALDRFFHDIERPVLLHCKSGADRAGFAAALWLMLVEGAPVAVARRQLSLRFGHVRQSKTGVLDAFFDAYAREGEARGMSLRDWIVTAYDPDCITRAFHARGWASLLIDDILKRE
ncbi:sulfur transferase domain-containing protein [Limibaculum sp. FT325]|uniref:tyrosine-protein phosphatase n=1 Tax=Thermohalobaculum sediminis TaxID=2939436 RepID=UPI0020BFF446|nr:sulfur transferase domain-containing protein [Limibaculum sediminis]MCL5775852.1 sulfur transferase domain-containing protein [Limibaculum sediminis]